MAYSTGPILHDTEKQKLNMSPQKLPTDKLTLYYSISNSFRDFDFKDATFENIANSHFVVGGLVTKDEKTISLRKLKSKLHITDNTVKEIKPEDIVAESLEECLSSDWLADFLQMMLDCDWMVYSININTFYHSLMAIADIMNIADSKAVGLLKKEICSWLYGVLKNDMQNTSELFAKYDFPNIAKENNKDFVDDLIKIIHKPFEDTRETLLMYTFMFLLQEAKKKKRLSSLQSDSIKTLPKIIEDTFRDKIMLLGNPAIVGCPFMAENSEEEKGRGMLSADYLKKNCSDIVVEVLHRFLEFVSQPLSEVEGCIQKLDDKQMHCFKLLCQVMKDSTDYNSCFLNMLLPYGDLSTFFKTYIKYGNTGLIDFNHIR